MKKKLINLMTSRLIIVGGLIVLQGIFLFYILLKVIYLYPVLMLSMQLISIIIVLYIISNKRENPMYKLTWITLVLVFPMFGALFYLLFGKRNISRKIKRYMKEVYNRTKLFLDENPKDVQEEIKKENLTAYKQVNYIYKTASAPIYKNTYTKYLTPGEKKFECMLEELQKAKDYIFMEYFILEDGKMWGAILDILKEKVKQGVIVKVLYDDLGSVAILSPLFPKEMASYGIEAKPFNRLKPSLDVFMNHRDHRKICVIDGEVGFTGGINLADEYINEKEVYGHWKDASIVLKGEAVWSLTIMFLQLWGVGELDLDSKEYIDDKYKPKTKYPTDGYVQPLGDSPIDDDLVGEMVYMNIINSATKYVYISTPYLILDNEMLTALCVCAESGVDVRIVTPHIPDKWFVHTLTRSYYGKLIESGVKVYEYTPGFIHSKTIVCDDEYAVVGTINFDFRSFYLHFECGVFLYKTSSIFDIKQDYFDILEQSQEQELEKPSLLVRLLRSVLSILSPLF